MTDALERTRAVLARIDIAARAIYESAPELNAGKPIPWESLTTRHKNSIRKPAQAVVAALDKSAAIAEDVRMRVARALELADCYGNIEGGHHRKWVIDQMVRALCGCPVEQTPMEDGDGRAYVLETLGENDEYRAFVAGYEGGRGAERIQMGAGDAAMSNRGPLQKVIGRLNDMRDEARADGRHKDAATLSDACGYLAGQDVTIGQLQIKLQEQRPPHTAELQECIKQLLFAARSLEATAAKKEG